MPDESVFPHEPDSTVRRGNADESLYGSSGQGRHRGTPLTPEEQAREEQAKGRRNAHGPGREGEVEIADPRTDRGNQKGYGKNQDKEQEKKTPHGTDKGAHPGQWRPAN